MGTQIFCSLMYSQYKVSDKMHPAPTKNIKKINKNLCGDMKYIWYFSAEIYGLWFKSVILIDYLSENNDKFNVMNTISYYCLCNYLVMCNALYQ